jgi:hypothetical protein
VFRIGVYHCAVSMLSDGRAGLLIGFFIGLPINLSTGLTAGL